MTHGHARKPQSATYQTWLNMRRRCLDCRNQDFARYGARGVTICDRWSSFDNFLADMGTKPDGMTLDRIDNDGNYEPGNCRWSTVLHQNQNRSSVRLCALSAVLIRYMARRRNSIRRIAEAFDVNSGTVSCVISRHTWPTALASLEQPT